MSKNQAFQVLVMIPAHRSFGQSYFSLNLRFKFVLGVNILIRLLSSSLLAIIHHRHKQSGWGENIALLKLL